MFGEEGTLPRLRTMIEWRNPDFSTDKDAPVDLWLVPEVLLAERIVVTLNGKPVEDYDYFDFGRVDLSPKIFRHSKRTRSAHRTAAVARREIAQSPG